MRAEVTLRRLVNSVRREGGLLRDMLLQAQGRKMQWQLHLKHLHTLGKDEPTEVFLCLPLL